MVSRGCCALASLYHATFPVCRSIKPNTNEPSGARHVAPLACSPFPWGAALSSKALFQTLNMSSHACCTVPLRCNSLGHLNPPSLSLGPNTGALPGRESPKALLQCFQPSLASPPSLFNVDGTCCGDMHVGEPCDSALACVLRILMPTTGALPVYCVAAS